MDGQKLIKFFKRYWFFLILILTFFLRLPSLFEPFTYGDEGIYLTLGQALHKGLVFYRDIHDNKPPLLYLAAAIAGNFTYFRLLIFIWSFLTIFIFYKLSSRLFAKNQKAVIFTTTTFAILTSLHTFEGNIANAENFMMLPTLTAILIFWQQKKLKSWPWLSIGALFSMATLFKVPAAFDLAAFFAFLVLTSRQLFKKLSLLVLGFFLPISLTLIYYASQGAFWPYFSAAFLQNIPYLRSWSAGQPQASGLPMGLMIRAGLIILTIAFVFLARNKISRQAKLIILWFTFSLFAALLSGRPYPHYLLQIIPALSLSLGLIFAPGKIKIVPVVMIIALAFSFAAFKFWHYQNVSYYLNFYQYALGLKSQSAYWQEFGGHTESLYQLAKYLRTHTQPEEKIFFWGNQPSIYVLADRLPVGRYASAYHIQDFDKQGVTFQQLVNEPPRFIITEPNLDHPQKQILENLLHQQYTLLQQNEYFSLYHWINGNNKQM